MSLFSSSFILFVLIVIGLYFLLPKKCQWVILLAASMFFYLASGWQGMIYVLVTIVLQYVLALALDRKNANMARELSAEGLNGNQKKEIKKRYASQKKRFVLVSVVICLGVLCFFKFANLTIGSVNQIFGTNMPSLGILAPLGLSYYTFKAIGYIIDVYRGRIKAQRNILKLALFIAYFPALVQGPIDRYEDLADQLFAQHTFDYKRFAFGAQRMLWGYVKKLVIAERVAVVVNTVLGSYNTNGYVGFTVLLAMVLYAFQIYADFAGGMDIVIGLSEIFGISLTENFRRPFFATSYAEYWQRWHITLGAWMRTYVFYPLSLSPAFSKMGRKYRKTLGDKYGKLIAPTLASFITFFLLGMWHGAGWKYVLYSVYQGVFVSTGTLFQDLYARGRAFFKINAKSASWHVVQMLRTFLMITITRYIILAKDLKDSLGLVKATFAQFNPWVFFDGTFYTLGLNRQNFWLMLYSIVLLLTVDFFQERGVRIRATVARQNIVLRWSITLRRYSRW